MVQAGAFFMPVAQKSVARYCHSFVIGVTRCSPSAFGAFLGSPCAGKFLRWSLLLGLLYTFINPPFAINDERSHMLRVHELTEGRLISRAEDGEQYQLVPKSYYTLTARYTRVVREPQARTKLLRLGKDLISRKEL